MRQRAGSDPARRERMGTHPWVRLPAGHPPGTSDEQPGPGRVDDPPSGAVPPGGRRTEVGERGARPPDLRVPRIPVG